MISTRFLLLASLVLVGGIACTGSNAQNKAGRDTDPVVHPWSENDTPVWDMAFLPDGKQLLSASDNGLILCDVKTGRIIRSMFNSPTSDKLVVSDDGKYVLATGGGGIGLWEISTGEQISFLRNQQNTIHAMALSANKRLALVAGNGRHEDHFPVPTGFPHNLDLWDTEKQEVIQDLSVRKYGAYSIALSRDGKLVLSTGFSDPQSKMYIVRLSDWQKEETVREFKVKDFGEVSFSRDEKLVYSVGNSFTAWDIETGALIHSLQNLGRKGWPIAFSPDKRYYITREFEAEGSPSWVTIWDLHTGKVVKEFEKGKPDRNVSKIIFSPNQKLIALAGEHQLLQVWNVESAKMVWDLRVLNGTR